MCRLNKRRAIFTQSIYLPKVADATIILIEGVAIRRLMIVLCGIHLICNAAFGGTTLTCFPIKGKADPLVVDSTICKDKDNNREARPICIFDVECAYVKSKDLQTMTNLFIKLVKAYNEAFEEARAKNTTIEGEHWGRNQGLYDDFEKLGISNKSVVEMKKMLALTWRDKQAEKPNRFDDLPVYARWIFRDKFANKHVRLPAKVVCDASADTYVDAQGTTHPADCPPAEKCKSSRMYNPRPGAVGHISISEVEKEDYKKATEKFTGEKSE